MFQVSKTKDSCSSQSSRIWYQHDGNFLWVLIISVIINVESYVLPRCRHVFWSKYRILKRELYWECRYRQQRQSPVGEGGLWGGVVGILPWKIFKIEMLENDISSILRPNLSVCCNVSFFLKKSGVHPNPWTF